MDVKFRIKLYLKQCVIMGVNNNNNDLASLVEYIQGFSVSYRKYCSLDRIIDIKTILAQIRRVGELKSIFGFRMFLHVNSK